MADYIPPGEANKIVWLNGHNTWMTGNGAANGFTPTDISETDTATNDANTAVTDHAAAKAAAQAATATKRQRLAEAIERARSNIQRLQAMPGVDPAVILAAGGRVRDTTPTPSDPDFVMTLPPPIVVLDFSIRRQVTVHWGTNPGNERENARPEGTLGVQIEWARGGIPTDEASWVVLDQDTESPYLHILDESQPITLAYRARWIGKRQKHGMAGDPVVCTISV